MKAAARAANIVIGKLPGLLTSILPQMTKLVELRDNSDTLAQAAAFGKRLPTLVPQPTPQPAAGALDGLVNLAGS